MQHRERHLPLLILAAGLLFSAMAAHQTWRINRETLQAETRSFAEKVVDSAVDQMERTAFGLRGTRGFFLGAGVDGATQAGFRGYFDSRNLTQEFPGVMGIGFIRRIEPAAEADFVAQARRQGAADFRIHALQPHAGERRVIQFIEPMEGNRAAVGLDVASEPSRLLASSLALESDRPILTSPIRLVQSEPGSSLGLLMMLRMPPAAGPAGFGIERGSAALVYSAIQLDRLLQAAKLGDGRVRVQVADRTEAGTPKDFLLPGDRNTPAAVAQPLVLDREVMGRQWRFTVEPLPALAESLHPLSPWLVGGVGGLMSVLLALLARASVNLSQRTRADLAERTRLATLLDHANDAIVGLDPQGHVNLWNRAATAMFGFTAAEAMGRPLSELTLTPEHAAEDALLLKEALAGRSTTPFETQRRHRNGDLVDVELSAGPVFDDAGQVVGAAKALRPIKERLEMARRLQAYTEGLEQRVAERTRQHAETEQDLRNVLDALPSMVGSWDRNLRNRFANKSYSNFFARDAASLRGTFIQDLLGPELLARNKPYIDAVLMGEEQRFERDIPRPDGQGVNHTLAHYLPQWSGGEVVGFYVLVHDVSDVKRAQTRLQNIIDGTQAGTWEWNVATGEVAFNARWAEIVGYTLEELQPVSIETWMSLAHPQDLVRSGELLQAHFRGESPGYECETRMRHKDGHWVWVLDRGKLVSRTADGQPLWMAGTHQDISERKLAEQALINSQTMLSRTGTLARVGGWEIDLATGAIWWSDETCRIHGLPPGHRPTMDEAIAYYAPEARPVIQALVERGMRERKGWDVELPLVRADGQRIWVRAVGEVQFDGQTAVRLDGAFQDVTELARAREAAESASRAKSAFLASTSHEIRTPLNAILGLAYLLERGQLKEQERQQVRQIAQAGKALLALVNDVLDISKIEAGQLELETMDFDLRALVEEEAALLGAGMKDKPVELRMTIDDDVPATVRGDPTRLRQVLANLLSNALKFTLQGSVSVHLARGALLPWMRLEVSDTGIGIEPQVQDRLFKPFEQGDASTARRFGGSGLGLAITAQLVHLMGGNIALDSTPGTGSTFTVNLPLPETEGTHRQPERGEVAPLRVLMADDDALQLTWLLELGRSLGWHCRAVSGGLALLDDALSAARDGLPFDALVVDWQMPDLDGLSALARLQHQLPHDTWPAAVVVSQHELVELRAAPHAVLASALLVKPLNGSKLFNAVNESVALMPERATRLLDASLVGQSDSQWLVGVRLLVVDDSSINLDVARMVLELEGALVTTCASGEETLQLLRESREVFDAALLDVQMPGMDGIELLRRMRQLHGLAELPAIALTAGVQRHERDAAVAAGMTDFLAKPLEPRRLIRCLRRHVEGRRGNPIPVLPRKAQTRSVAEPVRFDIEGIDDDAIAPSLRRDGPLLLSMIRRLLAEYPDLDAIPRHALSAAAHKLRGSAGVVGATELARAAAQLETALKAAPDGNLTELVDELDHQLKALGASAREPLRLETERLSSRQPAPSPGDAARLTADELNELRQLIDQQNLRAAALVDDWATRLSTTIGAEALDRLRCALQEFDFAGAQAELPTDTDG